MYKLLPPNSTKLEKNIEQLGEKISVLPVPFIDLHSIDHCPVSHLPWLAWEHRVEYWQPDWNEQEKRTAISESESFNARRGTRSSIESLLSTVVANFQLKAWHEFYPPQKPFTFVVIISTQYMISVEQLLQIHTAIDATKSARDNYSISAKVKTDCDFHVTGSVTSGTKVYLSTYTDPFFWIVDSFIQFNGTGTGTGTATFTAISSDGFNIYSSYANLDLTEAIVRSLHDNDMQQWQAVKDACNELTGVTDWTVNTINETIIYTDRTILPEQDPTVQWLWIEGGRVPEKKKYRNPTDAAKNTCIYYSEVFVKFLEEIQPNSNSLLFIQCRRGDGYLDTWNIEAVANPIYSPNAQPIKASISFLRIAQKIISSASSSNQAISLLAEAYLEAVANSIFNTESSKQFVKLSDLLSQFELNKTLAN